MRLEEKGVDEESFEGFDVSPKIKKSLNKVKNVARLTTKALTKKNQNDRYADNSQNESQPGEYEINLGDDDEAE